MDLDVGATVVSVGLHVPSRLKGIETRNLLLSDLQQSKFTRAFPFEGN